MDKQTPTQNKEYCTCGYQYNGITFYYGKCCKRCGKELELKKGEHK